MKKSAFARCSIMRHMSDAGLTNFSFIVKRTKNVLAKIALRMSV